MEHRHAIDCPGGPFCSCGVAPKVEVRELRTLPMPKAVQVIPTAHGVRKTVGRPKVVKAQAASR